MLKRYFELLSTEPFIIKKTDTNRVNKNGHQLVNMLYPTANYD